MRNILFSLMAFGMIAASANAAVVSGCTTYASESSNGTKVFPGTYVGQVGLGSGQVCQIGNLALYNGGSGGAFVNSDSNPSIYSFQWTGGYIAITEKIGNNGIGNAIDVDLYSLVSQNSTAPGTLQNSIQIPFSSGPSSFYTVYSGELSAGFYAIDTFLSKDNVVDPNFQVNISTPEPSTMLPLLGIFLAAFVGIRSRKLRAIGSEASVA